MDLILLKISNKRAAYQARFEDHLYKYLVPVGSSLPVDKELSTKISTQCEVIFIELCETHKKYYIGQLHDVISLKDQDIPAYYKTISVDYYNIEDANSVFVTRHLQKITEEEFKAYVGKYYKHHWVDEEGQPVRFETEAFLSSRANCVHLTRG